MKRELKVGMRGRVYGYTSKGDFMIGNQYVIERIEDHYLEVTTPIERAKDLFRCHIHSPRKTRHPTSFRCVGKDDVSLHL